MQPDFKILLVEDNLGDALLMEDLLSDSTRLNFSITHAETLKDGLEMLLTKEIDVVLLDLGLPDSQGLEALEAMLDKANHIPIVVITGLDNDETGRKAINMGAQSYIVKGLLNQRTITDSISYAVERNNILQKLRHKDAELEESNKRLKESNNAREKLIAMLSHDLRGPVKNIVALLELLDESYISFPEERKLKILKSCIKSGNSIIELMENLLDWARMQSVGNSVNPQITPLRPFIENTLEPILPAAEKKGIQVKNRISDHDSFYADNDMIATVLRNLVTNAVKFTPSEGVISISSHTIRDGKLKITIGDTGVGISKEDMGKIFDITEGFTTPGTNNEKGSGFGMILCKEFVEKNKGTIQIESEQGKGTTVSFILPNA